jgi:hypothetical protein
LRAVAGLSILRRHFGEDWPLSDVATRHPLLEYFTNAAPFTRVHLAQLGHAVDSLSLLDGWSVLLARLRHGREAIGALLELEVAYPALTRGWKVQLGPPTQVGRFADLLVVRFQDGHPQSLFIEVASVDDFSEGARADMSFQRRLVPYLDLHLAGLDVGGRLLIDPTLEQEEQMLAIADHFWKRCLEERVPLDYVLPGALELWAVPLGDKEAKRAMLARGHQDGWVGGVMDNPLKRLVRILRAKLGQLPLDQPGLIVLEPPPMLFRSFSLEVISTTIQEQVVSMPSLVAVALINWVVQGEQEVERLRHQAGVLVLTIPDRLIFWKQVGVVVNRRQVQAASVGFVLDLF